MSVRLKPLESLPQAQPDAHCIPAGLTSRQLRRVLAPLTEVRVLRFADAAAAWGGFVHSWVRAFGALCYVAFRTT